MPTELEELRVLQAAEVLADEVWKHVVSWDDLAKRVVGEQLARAIDSIGANIAEAYGRFHYTEKAHHLYYARGSVFETKYWLNRCKQRQLIAPDVLHAYNTRLTEVARQINAFASALKKQKAAPKAVREAPAAYTTAAAPEQLFSEADLAFIAA